MNQQVWRYSAAALVAMVLLSGCSMLGSSGPAVEMTVNANETGPFEFDAEAGDTIVVDVQHVRGDNSFLQLENPQDEALVQEAIVDEMHETFVVQVDGTFSGNFVSRGEGRLTIEVE